MFSNEQSLLSATSKKSARPVSARSVSQVSIWVRTSVVLPLAQRKCTGTPSSALVVRMNSSCFKSGLWSLLNPNTTAGAVRPRTRRPPACRY